MNKMGFWKRECKLIRETKTTLHINQVSWAPHEYVYNPVDPLHVQIVPDHGPKYPHLHVVKHNEFSGSIHPRCGGQGASVLPGLKHQDNVEG